MMNDRIKEILIETGYFIPGETGYLIPGDKFIDSNFCQKFAALIVQECLVACSRANEIRHFVQPRQEQVVLDCMLEIEKTFRS